MHWQGGTACADITPDAALMAARQICTIGAWEERALPMTHVRAPLKARVVYLSTGQCHVALIGWDGLGDAIGLADRLRARWCNSPLADTGLFMAASHAHTTPDTLDLNGRSQPEAYLTQVADNITAAVMQARATAQPLAKIEWRRHAVDGVAWNRRPILKNGQLAVLENPVAPEDIADPGVYDNTLTILRLCRPDGTALARIAHWTCHGVCMQAGSEISPGFIGTLCANMESILGAPALFLNGAAGDINPVNMGSWDDDDKLADALTSVALNMEQAPATGSLMLANQPLAYAAATATVARRKVVLPESKATPNDQHNRHAGDGWNQFLRKQADRMAAMPETLDVPVTALRIGPLILAGAGGELFAEFGAALQKSAAEQVLPVSYVNGYRGYLASRRAYELGGYETSCAPWCPLAAGQTEKVVAALAKLIEQA
jgi:neutral ceramidase